MMMILLLQPDLGSSLILGATTLVMLFVAGARVSYIVMAILAARDGTMYVGSERGLKRMEGDRLTDVPFPGPDGRRRDVFVLALAEDGDGVLWAGTGRPDP